MKRLIACAALLGLIVGGTALLAADKEKGEEPSTPKAALQALNEFIGDWKGNGSPEKPKPASKELWNETIKWSWRFKGDDAWLVMDVTDGKYFKGGEMRYLPDKKFYQMTMIDKSDNKLVFEGEIKNDVLTLERVDPQTKETQQIKMSTAAEGIRFLYYFAHKPEGKTLYVKDYMVASTKEGESIGAKEKKNECIVSGGLGTIAVSYKGVTYYVCCSGCKDAFTDNPEKFIKEFEAKKNKK
jgi:YHS domain